MFKLLGGAIARRALQTAPWLLLAAGASAQVLTVDAAMRRAAENAPAVRAQLAIAAAMAESAQAAAALPDPRLRFGLDNWPIESADKFSSGRDFMTMRRIGISREMVREEKLDLRAGRARVEAERENLGAADRRLAIRREVALAYVEGVYAGRGVAAIDAIAGESRTLVEVLIARVRAGTTRPLEAVAAQAQVRALEDRRIEIELRQARSRAVLARRLGDSGAAPLAGFELARAREDIIRLARHDDAAHPQLGLAISGTAAADNDLAQARAAERGDWSWEVAYQKRGAAFTDMLSVGIAIDLPQWNRGRIDPEVRARERRREAARETLEEARRAHALERALGMADWDNAQRRHAAFDSTLLPLARDRAEQAMAAYRGGGGNLAEVLEARRAELETRLARLDLEAAAARAWAQLVYFMHTEDRP